MPLDRALQKRLIDKRARALAAVRLTRRRGLDVREEPAGSVFDMTVRILSEDTPYGRPFAVFVRGRLRKLTDPEADRALKSAVRSILRDGSPPLPAVLLLFTMHGDQGWYTWVAEPIAPPSRSREGRIAGPPSARPLDDEAIDEIVSRVNQYYEGSRENAVGNNPRLRLVTEGPESRTPSR